MILLHIFAVIGGCFAAFFLLVALVILAMVLIRCAERVTQWSITIAHRLLARRRLA